MFAPWVVEEMKATDLKDKRLNERLRTVLSDLSQRPTASIPAACGGHAEMTAAYRLFDNAKVTSAGILTPHVERTRQRVASQPVAILAQDTTEIDLTRPTHTVEGAGPLDGNNRAGALAHCLHAFTPDGTPLGTAEATLWTRADQVKCATLTRAERAAIPIEQKESHRWIQTLRHAQELGRACPETQCVCVSDSEADIYELLEAAQSQPDQSQPRSCGWIVRACQNRALLAGGTGRGQDKSLRERVRASPVLFKHTVHVRGRQAKVACETRGRRATRQSREAAVSVRATTVTLRPPRRPDRTLSAVTLNVVLVREDNPPEGEEPIEWLLLTNLPIDNAELVRKIIQYYCVRWMIEIFFRVLKSGCRVEERRFEHLDRLRNCLAVYLIVAWRTLYVCRLGRACPEMDCEAVFDPDEWRATWKVVRREDPPRTPPALGVMTRLVAQLGGYVNRKGADPPGPQTLWLGMQRVHDFAQCWKIFGPATET